MALSHWLKCTDRHGNPLPPSKRAKCNQYRALYGLDPLPEMTTTQTVQPGSQENSDSPPKVATGLGDTIAQFTHATGLDKLAKATAKAFGYSDCGCKKRQQKLNQAFPYKGQ